jgi:lipid II:glycine glycyltransferase (peptidoglycan interpeptide bridge formation enzyme)
VEIMRIVELTKKQFDDYAITNINRNFYQTSQYGTLMSRHGFTDYYVALINDNNRILAASLILIQKLFGSFKCAYSPRGFLIDFKDFNLLTMFINTLKEYLDKKGILYLKIDPSVIHLQRNNKGLPINSENNGLDIINYLKSMGFEHTGFNLYFENLKPRWNAVLHNTKPLPLLFNSFDKKTRSKIRKAEKRGVTVYKGTKDDIKLFYSLIDKKHTRQLNYYLDLYDIFGRFNMFEIYFAKLDSETFLKNSKLLYENEIRVNAEISERMQQNIGNHHILNKKMESDKLLNMYKNDVAFATKLFQANPKQIILATNAIIKYDNEIFFLIDGINQKFRSFDANYSLKWKIVEEYSKLGFTRFHLNGITGDFNIKNKYYGLYDFKIGFNADVTEYIGEFNLIINKLSYSTYKNLKPLEKFFGKNLRKS